MKSSLKWLVALSAFATLGAMACGGDDDTTECGEGTELTDGVCVSVVDPVECGPGTSLNITSGTCEPDSVAECGEGTTLNETTGMCEADATASCGDNTTEVDGVCVPDVASLCGDDTEEVDGACVPVQPLCEDGEVWDEGAEACIDTTCADDEVWGGTECVALDTYCGAGTIWMDGVCEPIDPMTDVEIGEGEDNNNPFSEDGVPVVFELGGESETVVLGGVIDAATETEDGLVPDMDGFAFMGEAGQRIQLEVTSFGAAQASVLLTYAGEDEDMVFQRVAVPISNRNAVREVVLPADGAYVLAFTERHTMELMLGLDAIGDIEGNADATYTAGITVLPAAEVRGLTELPFDSMVDLGEIGEYSLSADEGAVFSVSLMGASGNVAPEVWGVADDFSELFFTGDAEFVHPGGTIRLVADYFVSFTNYMEAQLLVEEVPVMDGTLPLAEMDVEFDESGAAVYGFEVVDLSAVNFMVAPGTDSVAMPYLRLLDGDFQTLIDYQIDFWTGTPIGLSELGIVLEPGDYFVEVSDFSGAEEGTMSYNIDVMATPIMTLDNGTLDTLNSPLEAANTELIADGDAAWYTFSVGEIGRSMLTATPVEGDVAFSFYSGDIIHADGADYADAIVDDMMAAEAEMYGGNWGMGDYYVRVEAVTAGVADATINLAAEFMAFPTVDEVEPNDDITAPQAVDAPTEEGGAVAIIGELTNDTMQDCFSFTAGPGVMTFSTGAYGETPVADTVLELYNAAGELIASNDDFNGLYSAIEAELPAGDYTVCVMPYSTEEGGYMLLAEANMVYTCFPGDFMCSEDTDLQECGLDGEWMVDDAFTCPYDAGDDGVTCVDDAEMGPMCETACVAGETMCGDDGLTLSTCDDDEFGYTDFVCPTSCQAATDDMPAMCEMICEPGVGVCSDDNTQFIACADDGYSEDIVDCFVGCGDMDGVNGCLYTAEMEPNDDGATATGLTIPFEARGEVSADDTVDVYTFTVDADGDYELIVGLGSSTDTRIWLYSDAEMTSQVASNDDYDGLAAGLLVTLPAGQYWARVEAWSWARGSYVFTGAAVVE